MGILSDGIFYLSQILVLWSWEAVCCFPLGTLCCEATKQGKTGVACRSKSLEPRSGERCKGNLCRGVGCADHSSRLTKSDRGCVTPSYALSSPVLVMCSINMQNGVNRGLWCIFRRERSRNLATKCGHQRSPCEFRYHNRSISVADNSL